MEKLLLPLLSFDCVLCFTTNVYDAFIKADVGLASLVANLLRLRLNALD